MLTSVILDSMAAGIIFIFSDTIMPTLATLDTDFGISIMNEININIVNPTFAVAFFGGLISAYPAGIMWKNPNDFTIPRNNVLLAVDPESEEGASYWEVQFLKGWVGWNNARCFFSVTSAILGGLSLAFMRKS